MRWGLKVVPWVLVEHFARRFSESTRRARSEQRRWMTIVLWFGVGVGAVLGFMLSLLVLPLLVALIALLLVVGLIPIPQVRSVVGSIQRSLAGSLGDSLILEQVGLSLRPGTMRRHKAVTREWQQEPACHRRPTTTGR